MIMGIGLDVTEIERVRAAHFRTLKFKQRILSTRELERFAELSQTRQLEFLAGRFAAKEAYAKALGTGIGRNCSFKDIEVLPNENGKPQLFFKNQKVKGYVSITHTKQFAAAQVILVE